MPRLGARRLALTVLITPLVIFNFFMVVRTIARMGPLAFDYRVYVEAAERFLSGDTLYVVTDTYAYTYSPLLAPALALVAWIGVDAWRFLHVAAALALPTWPMRLLTLASWPFWFDVSLGNSMTFVLLASAWALRGSRAGIIAVLLISQLVPRPLMIPIAIWVLWRHPEWRLPFVAITSVHAVILVATGWGAEWLSQIPVSAGVVSHGLNFGPTRIIGWWWLIVAIPATIIMTVRGRLGGASLLASPYWLPYYFLMLVLEVRGVPRLSNAKRRESDVP